MFQICCQLFCFCKKNSLNKYSFDKWLNPKFELREPCYFRQNTNRLIIPLFHIGCTQRINIPGTLFYIYQSWAFALFFQLCSPLSAQFLSMDGYHSITHFADFQVRSSLNRSKKTVVHSWKRALKRSIAPETTAVCSF